MPRIEQDPTNVACPDFAGVAYAAFRQIMVNNGQVNIYFNLEVDPMRSQPHGEKVLTIYQAKVKRQRHDDLARGEGFNIAQINQKPLSAVAEEVWDTVRTDAIKKFSTSHGTFLDMD